MMLIFVVVDEQTTYLRSIISNIGPIRMFQLKTTIVLWICCISLRGNVFLFALLFILWFYYYNALYFFFTGGLLRPEEEKHIKVNVLFYIIFCSFDHLGGFHLTEGLKPLIKKAQTPNVVSWKGRVTFCFHILKLRNKLFKYCIFLHWCEDEYLGFSCLFSSRIKAAVK